jgi:hypothetical protein
MLLLSCCRVLEPSSSPRTLLIPPIHSQTRATSPPRPSRTAARMLAFPSTTLRTRLQRFSRRLPRNSERSTSSRSCPIGIYGSRASPRACRAACVARRSSVVATNSGTRAISERRARTLERAYIRAPAHVIRSERGSRYARRDNLT